MIHVPDVRATAEWYERIGFRILRTNEPDGEMDWASLSYGSTEIMLSQGGQPSASYRREVDCTSIRTMWQLCTSGYASASRSLSRFTTRSAACVSSSFAT